MPHIDIWLLVAAATPGILAALLAHLTRQQMVNLEVSTNHRMDELLAAVKVTALLEGEAIGKSKEVARANAAALAKTNETKDRE